MEVKGGGGVGEVDNNSAVRPSCGRGVSLSCAFLSFVVSIRSPTDDAVNPGDRSRRAFVPMTRDVVVVVVEAGDPSPSPPTTVSRCCGLPSVSIPPPAVIIEGEPSGSKYGDDDEEDSEMGKTPPTPYSFSVCVSTVRMIGVYFESPSSTMTSSVGGGVGEHDAGSVSLGLTVVVIIFMGSTRLACLGRSLWWWWTVATVPSSVGRAGARRRSTRFVGPGDNEDPKEEKEDGGGEGVVVGTCSATFTSSCRRVLVVSFSCSPVMSLVRTRQGRGLLQRLLVLPALASSVRPPLFDPALSLLHVSPFPLPVVERSTRHACPTVEGARLLGRPSTLAVSCTWNGECGEAKVREVVREEDATSL